MFLSVPNQYVQKHKRQAVTLTPKYENAIWDDETENVRYVEPQNINPFNYIKSASTLVTSIPYQKDGKVLYNKQVDQFQPPYSTKFIGRLANAWEFDPFIRIGLNRLTYFVFGRLDNIKATIYPNTHDIIRSELEAKGKLEQISIMRSADEKAQTILGSQFTEQEQQGCQNYLDNCDRISEVYTTIPKSYKSAWIFGRSAAFIERSDIDIPELSLPRLSPIAVKPLNSKFLGKIRVNPINWTIKEVEYSDPRTQIGQAPAEFNPDLPSEGPSEAQNNEENWLDAANLIYFVRDDDNIVSDSYGYGLSGIQPIISNSEETRRIINRVFPELNESQWSGTGLWNLPNWSKAEITNFLNSIRPGKHIAINAPEATFQEAHLQMDYAGLLNVLAFNKAVTTNNFGIPSFLMGEEKEGNRSNGGGILATFQESTIELERSWIREVMDRYWYRRLLKLYFPGDMYIHIKLKIITEFENTSFDTLLEKAFTIEKLKNAQVITTTESREMIGRSPLTEAQKEEINGILVAAANTQVGGNPTSGTGSLPRLSDADGIGVPGAPNASNIQSPKVTPSELME